MKHHLTLWQVKRWEIIGVDLMICYYVYWLCFIEVTFYLCTIPGTVVCLCAKNCINQISKLQRERGTSCVRWTYICVTQWPVHLSRQLIDSDTSLNDLCLCTYIICDSSFDWLIDWFIHLHNGFHFLVRTLTNFDPIR